MDISIGMDGDIVILDLVGDLVASTAEELKAQALKLTEKHFNYIMLDMSKVNFMDSSGLGACMAVYKLLNEKNGMFVCCQPSDAVSKIFRITRADKKITVSSSKSEAIKALQDTIISAKRQK